MTKQLKCYYLLLIRYYKLSLLNQFLEGYSIIAAWGNNFFKKIFFLLFFHFSAPLKCHWPIRASSLKSHSPAGRIYLPLATGRVLMKRLLYVHGHNCSQAIIQFIFCIECMKNLGQLFFLSLAWMNQRYEILIRDVQQQVVVKRFLTTLIKFCSRISITR